MSKNPHPNRKLLLVALSTARPGPDGEEQRVRFKSKSVVDLTDEELETLDKLTVSTGKLHYRDPIREGGGEIAPSDPEIIAVADYAGQDVPFAKKNVDQLKAYLDFNEIGYEPAANKAALLKLAEATDKAVTDAAAATGQAGAGGANPDPDAGL